MTVRAVRRRPLAGTPIISRVNLVALLPHKLPAVLPRSPLKDQLIQVSLRFPEALPHQTRVVQLASAPSALLVVREAGGTTALIVQKSLNGARRCLRNTGVDNLIVDPLVTRPSDRPQVACDL